jgi:hypothetical protein
MDIEDFEAPNSWISVRALRDAANIRSSLQRSTQRKVSSPRQSSPQQASKPSPKLSSPRGYSQTRYTRYNTNSIESFQPTAQSELEIYLIEKKYAVIISRLNQEITILSSQLKQSNNIIAQLSHKLNEINHKHALHIQALQERHEQEIKRKNHDMEYYLKEIDNYPTRNTTNENSNNLNHIKHRIQSEILEQKKIFQEEIEKNNFEQKKQTNILEDRCLNFINSLKDKFLEELEYLENKHKQELISINNKQEIHNRYSSISGQDEKILFEEDESEVEEDKTDNFFNNHNFGLSVPLKQHKKEDLEFDVSFF